MPVMNLKRASACLENYILNDTPVMLSGAPGLGKTSIVRQAADRLGMGLVVFILSIRDAVDLRGYPHVDPKTGVTRWMPPAELPTLASIKAGIHPARGILFIDEINHAAKSLQRAAMGLVLTRKIGDYELPKGWVVVAAGNRLSDRADVERMGTALRNRLAHIEVVAEVDAWCLWATRAGVSPMLVAWIRMRPEMLHMMPGATGSLIRSDDNAFPTPRSIEEAGKYINAGEAVRFDLIAGIIGDGPANDLEGFIRIVSRMPDLDLIKRSPRTAPLPTGEPAMLFALSSALARVADKTSFANIVEYAERMPPEFNVLTVMDAVAHNESLKLTRAFTQWALKHQDVVMS